MKYIVLYMKIILKVGSNLYIVLGYFLGEVQFMGITIKTINLIPNFPRSEIICNL